jgi:phage terminase large subunit-like protein
MRVELWPLDRVKPYFRNPRVNDSAVDAVAASLQKFGWRQGYASMNAPTKKLEEVVLSGRLVHGGHSVLRWMAGNVSIETDAADNWKPSKKKSRERIDGIVALIMALERGATADESEYWRPEDGVAL